MMNRRWISHVPRVASSIVLPSEAVVYNMIKRDILHLHARRHQELIKIHLRLLEQTRWSHKIRSRLPNDALQVSSPNHPLGFQ